MSWKLTKKLIEKHKGTHLDPLSSTSTSIPNVKNSCPTLTNDNAASEISPIPLHGQLESGILIVTLYEGVGFSAPDQHKQVFNSHQQNSLLLGDEFKVAGSFCPPSQRRFLPYALLDFDKSQVTVNSVSGTTENPLWAGDKIPCKFDVSRVAELTVYLYLRNPNASRENQDIFLGTTRMNPLIEVENPPTTECLDVQAGTGKIRIRAEYVKNDTLKMDISHCLAGIGKGSLGQVVQVIKKDTQRLYALKTIQKADIISRSEGVHIPLSQINNPFIVQLKFAFQSPEKLSLFLPFVRGGHLFYYLQREQRFNINRSRFYAAELLCALECLHDSDIAYYDLKPRNILLDSLGHIALCDFGLYQLETKDEDRNIRGTLEYPAPELLLGQGYTKTIDWWTLGVILYELLIGLPPFYDEDTNEIHRKILSEPLEFPDSLPLSAKDILTKLLNRKPQQRLGANGISEIKAHMFSHDIEWHKLLQRKYEPAFKPDDVTMVFRQHEPPTFSEIIKQFSGWSYNQPTQKIESKSEPSLAEDHNGSTAAPGKDATVEAPILSHEANPPLPSELTQETVEDYDSWVLIWDEASQAFYFYNRFTNARQPVNAQVPGPVAPLTEALAPQKPPATRTAGGNDLTILSDYKLNVCTFPSQSQMQDALEAALEAGYQHMVPQLLEYGLDLNTPISRHGETPLEWAIEHENLDLVKLFLDKGADANFTIRGEPALIKAVEKGNQRIVEVLVQKTDRVSSTRALGRAVDQQDTTLVNMLLENGVKCDFEESDRPRPHEPDSGCYFFDISQPDEFIPPLVRAIYLDNVSLVRLLLANGADVNISYHDLYRYPHNIFSTSINMSCGRAIQLAMELRHQDMVELLLDFGADISLGRPVWKFHECQSVPREVYLRVIAGLRAVAAARN